MQRKARMLGVLASGVVLWGATTSAMAQDAESARKAVYPAGIKPIAPYSPAIQTDTLVFVSGQIPYVDGRIPDHASDGSNDVKDQTRIVMDNISTVLKEAGLTLENALMVTVFLTDLSAYGDFNEVYGPYWTDKGWTPPARAAVEVGALPGSKPDAPVLVEVSVIAGR